MQLEPHLIDVDMPADQSKVSGVVIVLHGGAGRRGERAVSPNQLSVLRMIPIAHRVARAEGERLAVFRLLNTRRGWDTEHTPTHDVDWAMNQVRERLGGQLPTCLIGHSLGGRAALLSAGADGIRSVVALAPWVYPDDAHEVDATGRRVLFVHGDGDRIAKRASAQTVAATMARTAADVRFVTVAGGKHAMLRHGRRFEQLAAEFAVTTLLGERREAPRVCVASDSELG
ncbi:MAG: alpha/beta fold hydrolase [Actinomycetota bacterium]|nr:alpha/beta fold hydrolase [Actinomycetota bacterium]